jgi:hypothetical protein
MEVKTIDGASWGFDVGQYIGSVFHTARTIQEGVREDACVFIADNHKEAPDLNVYVRVDDIDMDSTDINPFRQYSRPVDNILEDIVLCEELAAKLHGSNLNTIDRELVRMHGFTRII